MKKLKRLVDKIKLRIYKYDSWLYQATLLELNHPDTVSLVKDHISLKKLKLDIDDSKFIFLLIGYENALVLKESINATFKIENNKLFVTIDDLHFEVQTAEELFILKEIFVEGVYNFQLKDKSDNYALIDIGMNVAYASCYFAKIKKIPHIISFEPFTPTFDQAKKHIALNHLEDIIDARNYGLGGCDDILSVEYAPEFKGQMNMQGTNYIRSNITQSITEEIIIKKALEPLKQIERDYSTQRFIMKIDCEGAEYDLINVIPESLLQRCDLIMMEWHEKGPEVIEEWLSKHGFIQMSFYPLSKRAGMIYAIRN